MLPSGISRAVIVLNFYVLQKDENDDCDLSIHVGKHRNLLKMSEREKKIPALWFALKKSLRCESEPSDVYNPKPKSHLNIILTRKPRRSSCSRSIANLKDVIHGSIKHVEKPHSCSPRSIQSSEFLNPISHEVVLNDSTCELKITDFTTSGEDDNGRSAFLGTLRPGTPGPGGHNTLHYDPYSKPYRTTKKSPGLLSYRENSRGVLSGRHGGVSEKSRSSRKPDVNGFTMVCQKCGKQFGKWEALETHHLSKHAVTELHEGDSSRKIVEIICRTSWLRTENTCGRMKRILKVHNTQKTLARFEEHRDIVKVKASKLPKKHPRCIADRNELLRFFGTTLSCSLGMNGSSNLCTLEKCSVCRIIRHGFSLKKEAKEGIGIFTTSTSGRAYESIGISEDSPYVRRAFLICRVIAGRVHRPMETMQDISIQTGFDSLAGKVGLNSNIDELYLLNPRTLLPCFVVICRS